MTQQSQPRAAKSSRNKHVAANALSTPVSKRIAGDLALDFCNTAGEHLSSPPQEMLMDWESFIRWAAQAGIIDAATYVALLPHPSPINLILELREAIYRVGLATARKSPIPSKDLLVIFESARTPRPRVSAHDSRLRWRIDSQHASSQLRGILADQALALFCSPRAARIGICEGGQCGWLFIDESRGQRRRWCDMKDCGNAAKAKRYYQKKQNNE